MNNPERENQANPPPGEKCGGESVAEGTNNKSNDAKEMKTLNKKLSNLFKEKNTLQEENKKLKEENDVIKANCNIGTAKTLYEKRLDDMKALLEDKDKKLAESESQNESFEELVEKLRKEMHQVKGERVRMQKELETTKQKVATVDAVHEMYKEMSSTHEKDLTEWKTSTDELKRKLRSETTKISKSDSRITELEKELLINKEIHEAELNGYKEMKSKLQEKPKNQEFQNSIYEDMTELEEQFEIRLKTITDMMERKHALEIMSVKLAGSTPKDDIDGDSKYSDMLAKISDCETQIKNKDAKIKKTESQLLEFRKQHEVYKGDVEKCLTELATVPDQFSDPAEVRMQIKIYRTILDKEERMRAALSNIGGFQTKDEEELVKVLGGASKMTMSRSTTGRVSVVELATDGKYIKLEDLSKSRKAATNIENWTLTQTLENGKKYTHTFTDGNVFSSDKTVKIWGSKHGAGQGGVTASSVTEWGTVAVASTITLKDDKNNECDSKVMKINA